MESHISIQAATARDTSDTIRLWKEFMHELRLNPDEAMEGWLHRLGLQIAGGLMLVASFGGQISGFIGSLDSRTHLWVPDRVLYLVDIYVLPEARSRGLARRLIEEAAALAVETGYREIWTNTDSLNRPAQRLLRRTGFLPLVNFYIPGLENHLYYRLAL